MLRWRRMEAVGPGSGRILSAWASSSRRFSPWQLLWATSSITWVRLWDWFPIISYHPCKLLYISPIKLTTKYIRKQHIRDYHSLFLGHGRTGSRLSQRCPDAGSSPVIHIQSPANGLTNGRVPNQRSNDQSDYHHNQNNLLSNASPTTGNRSFSITAPLFQDLSLQRTRKEPYLGSESSAYSSKKV